MKDNTDTGSDQSISYSDGIMTRGRAYAAQANFARVVINERTGTVVVGGDVRIGAAAVAHGNLAVRIATKYPRITTEYFTHRGIPVEIIPLSGSVELAPLLGLSDRIVDLVSSGRTLAENGLEIVEPIMDISARLVVNRASYQIKRRAITGLIEMLSKVVEKE
jgi:ATP phosphoribosyltransferase